ncbi:MAG TPA: YopX family protein [Nitrospira sp.]|nr:YopX family protein [Nitrospira sp.]HNA25236.1 YopX family protein [Nitrospira sp.]HNI17526.1 YopX family protein [Nitrospira sp.]
MRPIKFRVFDTHHKCIRQAHQIDVRISGENVFVNTGFGELTEPYIILMQFTGLLDKNGKEIYEGDIVKQTWQTVVGVLAPNEDEVYETEECITEVVFENGAFCLKNSYHNYGAIPVFEAVDKYTESFVEVIGNIWENPELLTH